MTFDETRASAFRMVFKDIPFSYGDFKIASACPICCVRSTIKFCCFPREPSDAPKQLRTVNQPIARPITTQETWGQTGRFLFDETRNWKRSVA